MLESLFTCAIYTTLCELKKCVGMVDVKYRSRYRKKSRGFKGTPSYVQRAGDSEMERQSLSATTERYLKRIAKFISSRRK